MLVRRRTITRTTPISIEREFSLFHPDARAASRATTNRFIESLRSRLEQGKGRYQVVGEVAGNCFEIKICFSNIERVEGELREAYRAALLEAQRYNLLILGISPPSIPNEFNEFFTTKAFPAVKGFLGKTNSIHIHVGGYSEQELVLRYRVGNMLAPLLLDLSQSSIVEGIERGRAVSLSRFVQGVPQVLTTPWTIRSFSEYYQMAELARREVEEYIRKNGNGNAEVLCRDYPAFARMNGNGIEILQISPDKIFHFARLRPDMKVQEKGLRGSVELRTLDGQATIGRDLGMIEVALGSLAHLERYDTGEALNETDIRGIERDIYDATQPWNISRIGRAMELIRNARMGLGILEIEGKHIPEVSRVVISPGYEEYAHMSDRQIVLHSAEQFANSVG
ncbi:MAG: hypothetical protein PHU63_00565 [Candidatus ainarchaeum sp.]|nr:hypothetical protein [Candidatus ainarchaeum sp.]